MSRLTRTDDNWIAGVCAGLGHHFGWSPGKVRLVFIVSCILPGPQILLYLALWILMPKDRSSPAYG